MKKLAIKGHKTRGNEIIEILRMLGGENRQRWDGKAQDYLYTINSPYNNEIECLYAVSSVSYKIFTLEEFIEKYPYKVGDRVQHRYATSLGSVHEIIKMEWEDDNVQYTISEVGSVHVSRCSAEYLKLWKIQEPMEGKCAYTELNFNHEPAADTVELILGDYEIRVEGEKTYLVKKKPTYPKTYEECCGVLMGKTNFQDFSLALTKLSVNINEENSISPDAPHITLINNFYKLLICRNSYWKIVGGRMGLGKSWEPDLENEELYCIQNYNKQIIKSKTNTAFNKILIFPTEEMRDAFYKNFKNLIEQCKELL